MSTTPHSFGACLTQLLIEKHWSVQAFAEALNCRAIISLQVATWRADTSPCHQICGADRNGTVTDT